MANRNKEVIPQDIEAEEIVLGAIMTKSTSLSEIVDCLNSQCFYKVAHRDIYEAMLNLYNTNKDINIVTVSDVLELYGKLESIGGQSFLNYLCLSQKLQKLIKDSKKYNIENYVKVLKDKSIKRALIIAGEKIVSEGYNNNTAEKSFNLSMDLICDIAITKSTTNNECARDLFFECYEKIEKKHVDKDNLTGCPTGFMELNHVTNGLQPSDLIVIASRPSMGKTTFALNIALDAAIRNEIPVAIFSLEMSKSQLSVRLMCSEAEIDNQKIKTGNLKNKDWWKIADAMEVLANAPIYIDDTPFLTIIDIIAKCRNLVKEEKNIGLIVIDYLQLMIDSDKNDRLYQASKISCMLKNLAKELNVPIILLSQISRAVDRRKNKRPRLTDLRETGTIEQDADMVIFVYRDVYNGKNNVDKAEIIIAKNRNGKIGSFEVEFKKIFQSLKILN